MYKKDLYGKTIRKKIVFHGGFYMFGLIIALISGALMSIQGVFNTEVTKQSSTWTTSICTGNRISRMFVDLVDR